jgi:bile acid-coenzyme A ligase
VASVVDERVREHAARTPSRPALVFLAGGRETVTTWAELERRTASPAAAVRTAVRRPSRTAVLARVGGGAASVVELVALLRTELPVAVMAATAPPAEVTAVRDELLRGGYDVVEPDGDHRHARAEPGDATAAGIGWLPAESLLLATGGSSGRPKLVVDTRMRSVARRPRATRPSSAMNWRAGQRQLVVGPLHHAAPLTFFIEGLGDGNTIILPGSTEPGTLLAALGEWRAEWLSLTPYHLRRLVDAAHGQRMRPDGLRGLVHLAAPCPGRLKREAIDLFGARRVFEMYGCTEGIGLTVARGDEWLRRPGTVGRGFFTRIRILDPDGKQESPGRSGEVYLRSGSPARRMYLRAGDSARVTADGFVSVGDRGRMDDEGYLYLEPRQLGRVQVGGETVVPGEIESVLMDYPGVSDAAVLGVPDDRLGESLVALVVTAGRPDAKVLKRYLRERVARHKVPRKVFFVERLPRTEAGKLDRSALAAATATETGGFR